MGEWERRGGFSLEKLYVQSNIIRRKSFICCRCCNQKCTERGEGKWKKGK